MRKRLKKKLTKRRGEVMLQGFGNYVVNRYSRNRKKYGRLPYRIFNKTARLTPASAFSPSPDHVAADEPAES